MAEVTREGKVLQSASVNDNTPSKNEEPFSTGEAANEEFSLLVKVRCILRVDE